MCCFSLLGVHCQVLEQEKHCLSLKLEASVRMEHSLMQEVEQLREHQTHQIEALAARAAQNHDQELQKHNKKVMVGMRAGDDKLIPLQVVSLRLGVAIPRR